MKYILIIICGLASLSLNAQESLSLSQAVELGLARNFDIQIERGNVEVASNNNSWGEAGALPNITLDGTSNNSITNQNNGNQFFSGQTFPGFQLDNQINTSIVPSVNLNWTLFDGGRMFMNKKRLENLQLESKGNADIVIANTVQAIVLGYYLAVLEKERLDVFKRQLELSSDKYNYTKVKTELGSAVTSDLLLEESNYLNDSINYINQELSYRNALRSLNILLAESNIVRDYNFTDKLEDEVEVLDYGSLVSKLEGGNLDLKKQYLTQAVLNNQVQMARADRLPTISTQAGYRWTRSVQDITNARYTGDNPNFALPDETAINKQGVYFANFTLSFTLFNGNRINRAIENAMIQEDIGNLRVDQLKLSLNKDLSQFYDQYNVRLNLYQINQQLENSAGTNLEISQEKFKSGTINSFDYRTVQNNYLSASIQRLQALYNLIDSKVSIRRITGELTKNL